MAEVPQWLLEIQAIRREMADLREEFQHHNHPNGRREKIRNYTLFGGGGLGIGALLSQLGYGIAQLF